jgi:iron complex transport system permease protein
MKRAVTPAKIIVTVTLCITAVLVGIGVGSVFVSPPDIIRIVLHKLFGTKLPDSVSEITLAIIWKVRIPRALCAFIVGAGLSAGGAVMQSVLANPLASGYTLGVSGGASLGVTLMLLAGGAIPLMQAVGLPVMGFVFGMLTVLGVAGISAAVDKNSGSVTIILVGMVMSLFLNAVVTFLMGMNREAAQQVIYWQMGSFSGMDWASVAVLFPVTVIVIILLMRFSMAMDVMTLGDEQALSTGVNLKAVKFILLTLSAVLTGVSVAYAGIVGFIDLIVPHAVRRVYGAKHRVVIPLSAVIGGAFTVICDLAARTVIAPIELPVGAVTAIIGAPVFAYILLSAQKERRR